MDQPNAEPGTPGLPSSGSPWTHLERELFHATAGMFKPDGGGAARHDGPETPGSSQGVFVSVICPTTASRRCFHHLLWMCFSIQTHKCRELVIVDTCEQDPSEFFVQKMKEDKRVVYRHFQVPESQWSIGLKRNLACYYAAGEVIAHFDDDDMYGPSYLTDMVKYLCNPFEAFRLQSHELHSHGRWEKMLVSLGLPAFGISDEPSLRAALYERQQRMGEDKFGAACAKLSSWHNFHLRSRSWGMYNACEVGDHELYGQKLNALTA